MASGDGTSRPTAQDSGESPASVLGETSGTDPAQEHSVDGSGTVRERTAKKPRSRTRFARKVTQRRQELDDLRAAFKVFGIDPEIFRILLVPSDPDFAFPLPVLEFDLHVSRHYPNQGPPPHIVVNNDDIPRGNAANIEKAFLGFDGPLVHKVRELDTELEHLLTLPAARTLTIVRGRPKATTDTNTSTATTTEESTPNSTQSSEEHNSTQNTEEHNSVDDEHSAHGDEGDNVLDVDSSSSSSSDYDPEYVHSSDEEEVDMGPQADMAKPKREGTEIVFSDIKLTSIALCEIVSLNMLFQCGRCKAPHTFNNLQSAEYGKPSKPRAEICGKCDLPLLAAFRKEYLHSASHTAGYLDVDGGRVIDLLPSSYAAMCGQCQAWSPVFKNVDMGAQRMMVCRTCHAKLWIQLEQFSFVLLSTETLAPAAKRVERAKLPAQQAKQKLHLTGGEPLPQHGACEHYRKSLRWFRFSCCQRVFACDRCHDAEMQHPSEQASRMVCGFCSREQRFNTKCVYCEHDYTQRVSRFWEGGTGVRDRKLMSRKDKRKYRRDGSEKKKSNSHFSGKSKEAPWGG